MVIARSALVVTVVGSVVVLLPELGSLVGLETLAVLVTDGTADELTATFNTFCEDALAPSGLALLQTTLGAEKEQLHPDPVADT